MSNELEAIGALTTAGLVIKSAQRDTGGHDQAHDSNCANCGVQLGGAYCHVCGQRGHVHRSLLHMGEELVHGIAHFDGKVWNTLPLLAFKPGKLTRAYIDGKRATYVSPMGLFLFVVFLMFLVFSFGHHDPTTFADGLAENGAKVSWDTRQALTKDFAARTEEARQTLADDVAAGRDPIIAAQTYAAWEAVAVPGGARKAEKADKVGQVASVAIEDGQNVHSGIGWLDDLIRGVAKNPELALYKIKNTAYKFSFLLVPISLPFIWLLFFWRRDVAMYDHAVFALYSLSFMSLLFTVGALLSDIPQMSTFGIVSLLTLVPPIHMYKQLKYTYGLSRFGAAWRTFILLIFSAIALTLFAAAILAVGLSE